MVPDGDGGRRRFTFVFAVVILLVAGLSGYLFLESRPPSRSDQISDDEPFCQGLSVAEGWFISLQGQMSSYDPAGAITSFVRSHAEDLDKVFDRMSQATTGAVQDDVEQLSEVMEIMAFAVENPEFAGSERYFEVAVRGEEAFQRLRVDGQGRC